MSILQETRGRKQSGFKLHRSKWRFAWLLIRFGRQAGNTVKELSGLVAIGMEEGASVHFGIDGKLELNSKIAKDWLIEGEGDSEFDLKTFSFVNRESHKSPVFGIADDVKRLNRKTKFGPTCFADIYWVNRSIFVFLQFYQLCSPGTEMCWTMKRDLWDLGWGHPLSNLPWSAEDRTALAAESGHDGNKMTDALIAEAERGVIKVPRK